MYGQNLENQIALSVACAVPRTAITPSDNSSYKSHSNDGSLGILTKTHVMPTPQGLQRVHDFLLQDQSAKLLPKERVCNCLKKRIDKRIDRFVQYNETRKKAHWGNVQRCGSIWTCPVCAKQVSEKRREELKKGLHVWRSKGSYAYLMSLTFSHTADQPLKFLLAGQRKALKRFYETTRVQNILKSIGVQYKIKALEVTYGQNGWHPHNHILLLSDQYLGISDFLHAEKELSELWIKACVKSGLNAPSMKYGLDLRDGSKAEKYISKWGLDHEMTKGHVKKGRNGGFTPFDLLQLSIENHLLYGKLPSKLWQEFGIATKGARQLEWGRGLKKHLEIAEKTDEELAEETEHEAITLRSVDNYIFSLLCHYQKRHIFLQCLERDYENGCFGGGETERLLIDILEKETIRLDSLS